MSQSLLRGSRSGHGVARSVTARIAELRVASHVQDHPDQLRELCPVTWTANFIGAVPPLADRRCRQAARQFREWQDVRGGSEGVPLLRGAQADPGSWAMQTRTRAWLVRKLHSVIAP